MELLFFWNIFFFFFQFKNYGKFIGSFFFDSVLSYIPRIVVMPLAAYVFEIIRGIFILKINQFIGFPHNIEIDCNLLFKCIANFFYNSANLTKIHLFFNLNADVKYLTN